MVFPELAAAIRDRDAGFAAAVKRTDPCARTPSKQRIGQGGGDTRNGVCVGPARVFTF
jgi:hypothetical protein